MYQLDKINKDLFNLEKTEKELLSELSKLQDSLLSIRLKKIKPLKEKRDKILLKNKDPNEIDISLVLNGNPSSTVLYNERKRQLDKLGLWSSGYFPSTGQTALKLILIRNDYERTKKAYQSLCLLLPHLKPREEGKKDIIIGIMEHTLSEYTSYSLHIYGKKPTSRCEIQTHYRSVIKKFENLMDSLKYIQMELYYELGD